MEARRIGFIGFGEVGRVFSTAMKNAGADVCYFDIVDKEGVDGIPFLPLEELIRACDILLSTVVSQVAVRVALDAARYLVHGKTYADMNSTSASTKIRISEIIEESGADFVEGAVLSAVGEAGPKASILVSGKTAGEFAGWMNSHGLPNLSYFSPKVGESSMVKMIRSVFSKGVECLLLEMLVAGRRAGLAEYLWKDIVDFMTKHPFDRIAENWIKTHPAACERRYHEMVQVVETLEEIAVNPIMTRGTRDFFERSKTMGFGRLFESKPGSHWDVADRLEKETRSPESATMGRIPVAGAEFSRG
jgi:3-hydroxyisobutyrate dehydrogenase-like beta-hydroxyacid dehydrogenase